MPLPVTELCSSAPNWASRFLPTRNSTYKCLLRFSNEFLEPTDEISKWYDKQPFTQFNTIQYRKERTAIAHEFVLLLLHGEESSDITSYCRVERVGDAQHLAQVVCFDGTHAEDFIQAIPLDDPDNTTLTNNSDIVAQITFPQTFKLRDVLAICCGISKGYRAKRYTLQQYNCFFFSWTVTLALARACMSWDVSPSAIECVNNIRDSIIKSIDEQGPARFRSIAYILWNDGLVNHEDEQAHAHPLDQVIRSRLYDSKFTDSMTKSLQTIIWPDRPQPRLIEPLREDLDDVASKFPHLTTSSEEIQSGGSNSSARPDQHEANFKRALAKLTQKSMDVTFDKSVRAVFRSLGTVSPACALLKQRLGYEAWFKGLKYWFQNPNYMLFGGSAETETSNSSNPRPYQYTESRVRDLCFIPPSVILACGARLMITSALSLGMFRGAIHSRLESYESLNRSLIRRAAQRAGVTFRSAIFGIVWVPSHFVASKHLLLVNVGEHTARTLNLADFYSIEQAYENTELREMALNGLQQALELFDHGLQEIINSNETDQVKLLLPCVLTSVTSILSVLGGDLEDKWRLILWQSFLDKWLTAAEIELKRIIGQEGEKNVFLVLTNNGRQLSQAGSHDTGTDGDVVGTIETSSAIPSHQTRPIINQGTDSWSHQKLQEFIRGRISQLSKRENNFAPYLKHIPFTKLPEVCQREIEFAIEEIWGVCAPLIETRPQSGP